MSRIVKREKPATELDMSHSSTRSGRWGERDFRAGRIGTPPVDIERRRVRRRSISPRAARRRRAASREASFLASGAIVRNQIATPRECLSYALTLPTSVVISGMDSMEVLEQNLEIVKNFKPLDGEEMRALLARVAPHARTGKFERFKTSSDFDGTARYPHWLG